MGRVEGGWGRVGRIKRRNDCFFHRVRRVQVKALLDGLVQVLEEFLAEGDGPGDRHVDHGDQPVASHGKEGLGSCGRGEKDGREGWTENRWEEVGGNARRDHLALEGAGRISRCVSADAPALLLNIHHESRCFGCVDVASVEAHRRQRSPWQRAGQPWYCANVPYDSLYRRIFASID